MTCRTRSRWKALRRSVGLLICHALLAVPALAADAPSGPQPTYADLADLSDSARLVLRAQIRSMARVEDARAPGLRTGQGRFYVKAKTRALLFGGEAIGDSLAYLVDLPLDARGKPPAIKKQDVLVFARAVPGRPGELQLVARDAQVSWTAATEARLRPILVALAGGNVPPHITGVRELIHVPGTLAGAGETQVFLSTADGSAASVTIVHVPGRPLAWGASFSELTADVTSPPRPETLEWYRLACFLPDVPPGGANLSETPEDRRQAAADYRMVLGELGSCPRTRR